MEHWIGRLTSRDWAGLPEEEVLARFDRPLERMAVLNAAHSAEEVAADVAAVRGQRAG